MGPRNKLFIRNGEKWTRILFSWTAGEEQTRSLQLYRLSANVCILEPQWLQHSCQVSKRPNDPSTHLLTVLLHPRYSEGQPDPQCEQNISKMRVEIGSGGDISCCQEVICIKHFLAEKILEKEEWLFWINPQYCVYLLLCSLVCLLAKHFTVGLSRVGVLLRSVNIQY